MMVKKMRRFIACNNGLAALEFVLFLPILLSMFLAIAELTRYTIIHQKLDNATRTMTDMVTRSASVNTASLEAYANTAEQLMEPYGFDDGTVIFSSVASSNEDDGGGGGNGGGGVPPDDLRCPDGCLLWQYQARGTEASRIGHNVGSPVILPQGYQLADEQNVIVVEVFYNYTPILGITRNFITPLVEAIKDNTIVAKPRQGDLLVLQQ